MERSISLDWLKLVMAVMVIGLHAGFLGEVSALGEYLTVHGLFRIAVPIFLIINGFYFFPVLQKGKQWLWLKRVLILYLVWMAIYSPFWLQFADFSLLTLAKNTFRFLIGYHHLWYISGMLGAALLMVYLGKFSSRTLMLVIALTYAGGVAIQYLGNYHVFEGSVLDKLFNFNWVHRNFLLLSLPFFALGFLLNKHNILQRLSAGQWQMAAVAGLALLILESWSNFSNPQHEGAFDNFALLIVVCPAVFLWCMSLRIQGDSKQVALYSSAIYFVHSGMLSVLKLVTALSPSMLTLATLMLSVVVSAAVIKINSRLKFIL